MPLIRITSPTYGQGPSSPSSKYVALLSNSLTEIVYHNLGSRDIIVQCFTENNRRVEPARCSILNDNEVKLEFSFPQNGRCIIMS